MAPVLYSVDTSPPCRSVLMLAKAIGLSFDVKTINLSEGDQLKPEFLKVSYIFSYVINNNFDYAILYLA